MESGSVLKNEKLRLLKKILSWSRRKGDCIVCYTNLSENGVPRTRFLGKKYKTHRLIMHLMEDLDLNDSTKMILHSLDCKSRACIEYSHLRIGNHYDNMQDLVNSGKHNNASKTHCKHGHELPPIGSSRKRVCNTCARDAMRKIKERKENESAHSQVS